MLIMSVTQFHYTLLCRNFRRLFWGKGSGCRGNVLIGNVYWAGLQRSFAFLLCNEHCAFILGLITCNNIPRSNFSSRTTPVSGFICYLDNFIIDSVRQFRTGSNTRKTTNHIQKCNYRREAFLKTKRYLSHLQNGSNSRYSIS